MRGKCVQLEMHYHIPVPKQKKVVKADIPFSGAR
jgi:hypothetical protein